MQMMFEGDIIMTSGCHSYFPYIFHISKSSYSNFNNIPVIKLVFLIDGIFKRKHFIGQKK